MCVCTLCSSSSVAPTCRCVGDAVPAACVPNPLVGGDDASLAAMVHEFLGAVVTMHASDDGIMDLLRVPTFLAGSHAWKPTRACRVTVCTAWTIADQPAVGCGHGTALVCAKCAHFDPHARCCLKCNGLF